MILHYIFRHQREKDLKKKKKLRTKSVTAVPIVTVRLGVLKNNNLVLLKFTDKNRINNSFKLILYSPLFFLVFFTNMYVIGYIIK